MRTNKMTRAATMPVDNELDLATNAATIERLERAISYAESDPDGGKVLLELQEARRLLKLLEQVVET